MIDLASASSDDLRNFLLEFERLCQREPLQQLSTSATALRERLEKREVFLAVIGQMKRGKSSLINALLGMELLPTGIIPLTSVITEIRYAPDTCARVHYMGSHVEEIPVADISLFVTERNNPGNRKGVRKLELTVACEILKPGVVLVDTPGIGSTHTHNSEATKQFLSKVDAAILVFSPEPPITEMEARFIQLLRSEIATFIYVLNKSDQVAPKESNEVVAFLHTELFHRLEMPQGEILPVSSLPRNRLAFPVSNHGVDLLSGRLRKFTSEQIETTLISSVAADIHSLVALASFAAAVGQEVASLERVELTRLRMSFLKSIEIARREQRSLKTLLKEEQADLLRQITDSIQACVVDATPEIVGGLHVLLANYPGTSGRALGRLLEDFLTAEVNMAFKKWRVQQDSYLTEHLRSVGERFGSMSDDVINNLKRDAMAVKITAPCHSYSFPDFAMNSKVTYKVEPVFFSLDTFYLLLPAPLQRRIVARTVEKTIASQLDRNAGKIRFDYLERLERTFALIEQSVMERIYYLTAVLGAAITSESAPSDWTAQIRELARRLNRDWTKKDADNSCESLQD